MTLKEIAVRAGVSISTVSRVINHPEAKAAGKEVENRIWEIVRETGYVANQAARSLKLGTTPPVAKAPQKTIACILGRSHISDPFFSPIARAIEQEAYHQGYLVKYVFSAYDTPIYDTLLNNQVDGVAVLGRYDRRLLTFLQTHQKRVVYTGLNTVDSRFDQIICDGFQASKAAVMHLAKLGHKKIAYVGEKVREVRYLGYTAALEQLKLSFSQNYVVNTTLDTESSYRAVTRYLASQPGSVPEVTALFCANDTTAIGAIKAVKEAGLSVPEDISVIGIDDIETAQYVSPMLTTIRIPMEELGFMSAKILIDRIENGKRLPMKAEFPFELVVRESCRSL